MEFLKSFLNLPDDEAMSLWKDMGSILSAETRSSNVEKGMNRFYQLMKEKNFVSLYQTLNPDQKSILPLLMIAQEDLKYITTEKSIDNNKEPEYELDIAS